MCFSASVVRMRFTPIVILLVVLVALSSASVFKASEYSSMFAKFTRNFKRVYKTAELNLKLNIFKANLDKITLVNAKNPGALHVNGLADISPSDFAKMHLTKAPQSLYVAMKKIQTGANRNNRNTALALLEAETDIDAPVNQADVDAVDAMAMSLMETDADADVDRRRNTNPVPAPVTETEGDRLIKQADELNSFADAGFDWRSKNVLTEPRHQKGCGSCWSYGTIAIVEAALAIKHKIPAPVLSEQHLVDCDPGNKGCNGGWYANALKHLSVKGARTTAAYGPYKQVKEECREDSVAPYTYKVSGVGGTNIFSYSMIADKRQYALKMISSLKTGPVGIAIYSAPDLQFWGSKIYTFANCSLKIEVNHAVVLVGVGKGPDGAYWIIRNSWGKTWGDGTGHFRMERHPTDNTCGYQVGAFLATV